MANAREIRTRMKSIKETRKITNAMKLISAAKLKRARQQLEQTLPFFKKIQHTMADILLNCEKIDIKYFDKRDEKSSKKSLYIIIAGDKGLAGGYNANLLKFAENNIHDKSDSLLITVGHVGHEYFLRKEYNVLNKKAFPLQMPTIIRAREIRDIVIDQFVKGYIDEVFVVYTYMVNSLRLEPQILRLLPLERGNMKYVYLDYKSPCSFIYEPSPNAVFDVLVPKYIKGLVYGALVQSFTSELSARMTAMDNATANADKMIQKLTLYYNRARQAAITQEISEIVGGAAVL